jgi:hypothetical protein
MLDISAGYKPIVDISAIYGWYIYHKPKLLDLFQPTDR